MCRGSAPCRSPRSATCKPLSWSRRPIAPWRGSRASKRLRRCPLASLLRGQFEIVGAVVRGRPLPLGVGALGNALAVGLPGVELRHLATGPAIHGVKLGLGVAALGRDRCRGFAQTMGALALDLGVSPGG